MKLLAILAGKFIILIGKFLKRGTSMPGKIALKIDSKLLGKFKIPNKIIAVTGSSGKGSTSSIIAHVYKRMGYKVIHNSSGANLTPGITTLFLENSNFLGKVKGDVVVLEVDERYAKYLFKYVKPTHVVITNITRDQPPRQGDFDVVYADIKKALEPNMHLILNGDDPYLLKFNLNDEYKTTYYTLDKNEFSYKDNKFRNLNISRCPKCNSKLEYNYYNFETLGEFKCTNCNFSHPDSKFHITDIDYDKFEILVNDKYNIKLQYNMLYCIYNTMAAFTVLAILGLDCNKISEYISDISANSKIYSSLKFKDKEVYILNNKNENSTTFNQSILFTERFKGTKTIIIGWKEISRRYEFSDLSWLYDIDFEILNNCQVENIACVGINADDIAQRMKLAGFDERIIKTFDNPNDVESFIDTVDTKYIFNILNFDYVEPFKEIFHKEEVL